MDYPFHIHKLGQLDGGLLADLLAASGHEKYIPHPNFPTTQGVYRIPMDGVLTSLVGRIQDSVEASLPKANSHWFEINAIRPFGPKLGEHSDVQYTKAVRSSGGTVMDLVLTHKVHIHMAGESKISFRRSRNEWPVEYYPQPGEMFWYNNYVLHQSENVGSTDRLAMSLVYRDPDWSIRNKLFDKIGCNNESLYSI